MLLPLLNVLLVTTAADSYDAAVEDLATSAVFVSLDIDETSIAAGIEHSCAIYTQSYDDVGGRVVCWGVNNGGQSSPPAGKFIQVSSGRLHSCGIRIDETVECWGSGAPVVKPEGMFEQVSSGDFHSCGIMKDQTVHCWGTAVGGISNPPSGKFVQVSCGKDFSCAIAIDGRVICWGENGYGQLNVDPNTRFRQISASPGDFVCGVTEDNTLSCWGDNHRNQASPPRDLKFTLVSTSRLAACGLKMDKTVVCWGMRSGVTAAPTDVQFDELSLGWNHGCAIRFDDGGVQCWGDRGSNRLEIPGELL
ncbi:Regulator of chromosome condensation 1/beta-lactamase-inhibitor protein II [Plasmopara halstedii]|uniref:non-specific serine/threonine protein kinase n=1 Tax=Plasmopara halstedii TaxID=4781 RepID=A0A0P1B0Z2_PLAHL|nr:Regulator of chromosome condensation 1/beta-lactamase-inhibitor protein II [Plasmopara halstedii]CEG47012.1 Regulator of chromosome condensation 1/beta-lactamase-inhibitor protein II [Plasmopara halstedii]|eukprot:XP_024583381.1 Regulator of chromosome condensation 1/beta-lactamase-inhibitor protein II [Plasmopara halstedii]